MTTVNIGNGKPQRKQLSDQLDRLDGILDALSEGLNGAVADAAREGTRLAVKDAIIEIMTEPTLRAKLREATEPEPAEQAKKPLGFWARLKATAGQAASVIGQAVSGVVDGVVGKVQAVCRSTKLAVCTLQSLGSLKRLTFFSVAVGVGLCAASYLAPHAVAAAISGVSGALAATAVQVGVWTRRAFRAFTLG